MIFSKFVKVLPIILQTPHTTEDFIIFWLLKINKTILLTYKITDTLLIFFKIFLPVFHFAKLLFLSL